jgi:hypothetical protein
LVEKAHASPSQSTKRGKIKVDSRHSFFFGDRHDPALYGLRAAARD